MKIALIADGFLGWQGGRDLFCMLVDAVNSAAGSDEEAFVWSTPARDTLPWRMGRVAKHALRRFPPDRRWMTAELQRQSTAALLREMLGQSGRRPKRGRSRISTSAFPEPADVVASHGPPPPMFDNAAWVAYLPDCQHRRLPQFFSAREIIARDDQYSRTLSTANVVVVNSREAKRDLLAMFSPFPSKIVSLPFSAAPEEAWLAANDDSVLSRYSITTPFFLCSNQFWIHKNHKVIFDAIFLAQQEGRKLNFVFTGAMDDYRHSTYVSTLLEQVRELGIAEHCRFLGLIPKIDQIQLMKLAVAVVQPTLFEGGPGGGAIFDAISLGRPTIVSELPVNREIEEYVSCYFDPASPRQLLDGIVKVAASSPRPVGADALRQAGAERRRRCGEVLLEAFRLAIDGGKRRHDVPASGGLPIRAASPPLHP
jgi:glycosyltransferase involved in cell wall biosynthesis